MKTSSERQAIDIALKRAAKDAVSGSREQRSGRFISKTENKGKHSSAPVQDKEK